ncbi:MAG: Rieske (2Fe-2S) iron-sulfur domain protein [Geminicoccaceae bacterium]|jgi:nitrite reductase/ring-hydroxylating ferredoxin subunit|nr:Rieske (2Fe-2S) iron-sulfur domain protein [Geminicoccaceae bacterium]
MISRDDQHEDGADEARPTPSGTGTIGRRTFLKQMEVLAGSAMCGALPLLGGCAARARYLTPTVVGDRLAVRVADAIAAGGLLVEDPRSDLPIFLRRTPGGDYTAVSTKCGHRGCQVEPAADRMACPCHGSEYTFEGAILQGPTQRALTRFRVTSDVEHVYIHIGSSMAP